MDKGLDVDIAMEQQSTLFANGAKLRIHIDSESRWTKSCSTGWSFASVGSEMKETKARKWWRFYKPSKFENSFQSDLQGVVNHYHGQRYETPASWATDVTTKGKSSRTCTWRKATLLLRRHRSRATRVPHHPTGQLAGHPTWRGVQLGTLETRVFMDPKGWI